MSLLDGHFVSCARRSVSGSVINRAIYHLAKSQLVNLLAGNLASQAASTMTAQGTVLQQRPSKVLLSGPKAARLQRVAQRVISQAQPSKPAQQGRPNTAVQASAVAEAPTHTSRVSEKALGDGPSIINGQVSRVQLISACFYTFTRAA